MTYAPSSWPSIMMPRPATSCWLPQQVGYQAQAQEIGLRHFAGPRPCLRTKTGSHQHGVEVSD